MKARVQKYLAKILRRDRPKYIEQWVDRATGQKLGIDENDPSVCAQAKERDLGDHIEALLADRGYDADAIRDEIAKAGVEAVIPTKSNRRSPTRHDHEKRWRHLVERLFNKLKNWRRVATPLRQDLRVICWLRRARLKLWIPFVKKPSYSIR